MTSMPKIIENARGLLIDEAKKQIEENGYDAVTIRSIAKGCQIGLGTFYNYFKSKDVLIATYLLEEWEIRLARLADQSREETDPMELIGSMYRELSGFIENNHVVFTAAGAMKAFRGSAREYHKLFISQMSESLCVVCKREGYENAEFLSEFVAESLLTWTVAKKDFEEIASIMKKLFVK
jgi:AcrR family transcriptional regulator